MGVEIDDATWTVYSTACAVYCLWLLVVESVGNPIVQKQDNIKKEEKMEYYVCLTKLHLEFEC